MSKQLSRSIPLQVRFGLKIQKDESGCWLWAGSKNGRGYGEIWKDGRKEMAHRVSWMIHRGPIPIGVQALHKCDIPACVNPDHLFLGSQSDNIKDAIVKGRVIPPCVFAPQNMRARK